jgi:hypothetical protein
LDHRPVDGSWGLERWSLVLVLKTAIKPDDNGKNSTLEDFINLLFRQKLH